MNFVISLTYTGMVALCLSSLGLLLLLNIVCLGLFLSFFPIWDYLCHFCLFRAISVIFIFFFRAISVIFCLFGAISVNFICFGLFLPLFVCLGLISTLCAFFVLFVQYFVRFFCYCFSSSLCAVGPSSSLYIIWFVLFGPRPRIFCCHCVVPT